MATKSTTSLGDLMKEARGVFAANPMIEPQIELFWKAQTVILEEAEAYSRAWFERHQEATRTALEGLRSSGGHGADSAKAMRAMVDWQQGSLQRLADDMQQWIELCSRCAGRMAEAEIEAGKDGAERATRQARSAAKTKHSTPV